MKIKPFRFAWNGRVLSKHDTYWILGTIVAALVPAVITAIVLITQSLKGR